MALTKEDAVMISQLFSEQLKKHLAPIYEQLQGIHMRLDRLEDRMTINEGHMLRVELLLENDMLPRLQNIEACYTSTYRRYQFRTEQIDTMQEDVNVLKKVVQEHSEMLLRLA